MTRYTLTLSKGQGEEVKSCGIFLYKENTSVIKYQNILIFFYSITYILPITVM